MLGGLIWRRDGRYIRKHEVHSITSTSVMPISHFQLGGDSYLEQRGGQEGSVFPASNSFPDGTPVESFIYNTGKISSTGQATLYVTSTGLVYLT